jgi:multimeric flavodoxin WrbA
MKVVTLLGSPKRKGNCATVLNWAVQELEGMGHQVECHHVAQRDVRGCLGCYNCQRRLDEPGCVIKDDAAWIFERMIGADAIIYASPLYFWSFPGQMKCLLDRHVCLAKGYRTPDHKSFLDGRHAALLITCDGPIEPQTKTPKQIFDRMQKYVKFHVSGKFVVSGCTVPRNLSEDAMDTAHELARTLAGQVMAAG